MNRRTALVTLAASLLPTASLAERLAVLENEDGFLNLRSGPGTNHPILQRIYDGMWVDVIGQQGNWRHIRLSDGRTGWASASFLGPVYSYQFYFDVQVDQTPDGFLNLRAGPDTDHPILQRLYPGQRLWVREERGRWARVELADGTTGWASNRYFYVDR